VVLIDCEKGFAVYPLHTELLTGQEGLATVAATVLSLDPKYVCRIQMGWAASYEDGNALRPSERPDKKEVLIVQVAEKGGQHELWISDIERNGTSPPEIVEWKLTPATTGPLAEAFERMMK